MEITTISQYGQNTETYTSPICGENGECTASSSSEFSCTCKTGFTGKFCQTSEYICLLLPFLSCLKMVVTKNAAPCDFLSAHNSDFSDIFNSKTI